MELLSGCQFHDPRRHGLDNPEEYTPRDFDMIRSGNLVFAYMEKTNPGGYALALE